VPGGAGVCLRSEEAPGGRVAHRSSEGKGAQRPCAASRRGKIERSCERPPTGLRRRTGRTGKGHGRLRARLGPEPLTLGGEHALHGSEELSGALDEALGLAGIGSDRFVISPLARPLGPLGQAVEAFVKGAGGDVALVKEMGDYPFKGGRIAAIAPKFPKIPNRLRLNPDEPQRVIIGTVAGTTMVGALTWNGSEVIRIVMFLVALPVLVWAIRGGNKRIAILDKAVADGYGFLALGEFSDRVWQEVRIWDGNTNDELRRHFAPKDALGFRDAAQGSRRQQVEAQLAYLEELRKKPH
jgi:hypothetical protein